MDKDFISVNGSNDYLKSSDKYPSIEYSKKLEDKIKQLEDENQRFEDIFEKINNWCKAYPKKNFIGKEFDLANHVLNGIQKLIAQKALEDK